MHKGINSKTKNLKDKFIELLKNEYSSLIMAFFSLGVRYIIIYYYIIIFYIELFFCYYIILFSYIFYFK